MKTKIEIPLEQLNEIRTDLKRNVGFLDELKKRTNHSKPLISMVLSGKRTINEESINIIIEAKKIIKESKEKSDAFIQLMQL